MNNHPIGRLFTRIFISLLVVAIAFGGGIYVGTGFNPQEVGAEEKVDLQIFWKVWDILNTKYVASGTSTTVTDEERVYGAVEGLVNSLGDPYTTFLPPTELKNFEEDISGNFEGVGMEVDIRDGVLTVVAPLKNTPAAKAGIMAGDKIIEINGESTENLSVNDAVKKIRGKAGTAVSVTIYRTSDREEREISMNRAVINVPAVETELRKDKVFVIRLTSFSALSGNQFKLALREFINSKSNKLIIDLRNNPGGYLESAVEIASWFLPTGKVIATEDFGTKAPPEVFRSKGYDVFSKDVKIAVLINKGSASASEILAGALREHERAILVGEQSFGKGSVQELIPVTKNTSVKVTIARWLTPLGNSISEKGIAPDYEVKNTEEDIKALRDPQMEKAAEILKK